MLLNNFESTNATLACEGTLLHARSGEFCIAKRGSKVVAGKGAFVVADEYSFVLAKKGSIAVALTKSFVVAEPGARVHQNTGSLVIRRSIDSLELPVGFARKKGEVFPERSMIIAYPGSSLKAGYGSIVMAPENTYIEVADYSQVFAGNQAKINAGRNCKIFNLQEAST